MNIKNFEFKTKVDNVKFHFDIEDNLGTFIEVDASDSKEEFRIGQFKEQCNKYFNYFGLDKLQLVDKSYSDFVETK